MQTDLSQLTYFYQYWRLFSSFSASCFSCFCFFSCCDLSCPLLTLFCVPINAALCVLCLSISLTLTERRRQSRVSEIERQRTQRAALIDTSRHLDTEQSQERTRQVTTTEEAEAREAETPTEIAQQTRAADILETGGEVLLRRQNRVLCQLTECRMQCSQSRARSFEDVKVKIVSNEHQGLVDGKTATRNIVYGDILS